jgi:hypothetical protein
VTGDPQVANAQEGSLSYASLGFENSGSSACCDLSGEEQEKNGEED